MEVDGNIPVTYQRNSFQHHDSQNQATVMENFKKKSKKWSLSGLFKKRRNKSSDTDSSSETDSKRKGLLSRGSRRRKGSHKVVGKFDAIILPKEVAAPVQRIGNCGGGVVVGNDSGGRVNGIQLYEASPIVIKRKNNIELPNGVSYSNREIAAKRYESMETVGGSSASLDAATRRNEKSKVKARVQALRDRPRDASSSSDDCPSSRNSSCSLQRLSADYAKGGGNGSGSLSRKSRAARTDRYIKRHLTDAKRHLTDETNPQSVSSDPKSSITPVGSPRSRWVAKVVYQQSNDYPMRYTAKTHSATSSPMSSPLTKPKSFQSSSLPTKNRAMAVDPSDQRAAHIQRMSSPPPPPPPPRNPNRKVVPMTTPAATAAPTEATAVSLRGFATNRPSSYAFDAKAEPNDISCYINRDGRRIGYSVDAVNSDRDQLLRYKSNSEMELRSNATPAMMVSVPGQRTTYPKNRNRYSADKTPQSRHPVNTIARPPTLDSNVYINRNLYADERPTTASSIAASNSKRMAHSEDLRREFAFTDEDQRSLSKANELGIPVVQAAATAAAAGDSANGHHYHRDSSTTVVSRRDKADEKRPLSVVSEKSDNDVAASEAQPKPRNLEEALDELEEIYNSLKLSDEDLLDRADRRDFQAALRMNPIYNRRPRSDKTDDDLDDDDDDDDDDIDGGRSRSRDVEQLRANRPRLPTSRRSAVPDTVADDMAFRKMNKRDNADVKSNPNVVSQSGSFLLMSPTLSPPPLVEVAPQPCFIRLNKEPDITFDDVVYRNIRHTNNTLKQLDPQPPFGIPVGPVAAAPNSDYLHAVPSEKYRSTFNPSRTPDVVKDDLAFRNLRKDVGGRSADGCRSFVPTSASKKRRAIRSLSANVVSLIGQRGRCDNLEANGVGNARVKANDRCASYNDLMGSGDANVDANADSDADADADADAKVDAALDSVAQGASVLGRVLKEKLREFETTGRPGNGFDKDVFAKRVVVVHKPITLSAFKMDGGSDDGKNSRNEHSRSVTENRDDRGGRQKDEADFQRPLKLTKRSEGIPAAPVIECRRRENGIADEPLVDEEPVPDFERSVVRTANVAPPKNVRASVANRVVETPPTLYEASSSRLKSDEAENSSSGVSSTSNTPDSARKCHREDVKELYLDENVLHSFERASEQFSQELKSSLDEDVGESRAKPTKKDFCSRIEIRLSTPQPAGITRRDLTQTFTHLCLNDLLIHFVYLAACLCEFFYISYSLYEILLVLLSSLAYFMLTRPQL